jgi:hypothetical protein
MELTVEQLIYKLQNIQNKQAKVSILINDGNHEDEEDDFSKNFDVLEFWEDREDGVTMFIGLQTETII